MGRTKGFESRVETFGRLYTWYAVTDTRGVCPDGWHLPSDAEWATLTAFLTDNGYGYEGSGTDIGKSIAATSEWILDPSPEMSATIRALTTVADLKPIRADTVCQAEALTTDLMQVSGGALTPVHSGHYTPTHLIFAVMPHQTSTECL